MLWLLTGMGICLVIRSDLPQHDLRPVLQRLGQVRRLDSFAPRQVRNRARQLQYPVIPARRQVELPHRRSDQVFPRLVQLAELANFGNAHVGVAGDIGRGDVREAGDLDIARDLDALADG